MLNPALRWFAAACLAGAATMATATGRDGEPALVEKVLNNALDDAEARCSYTRTKTEDGRSKRERYQAGAAIPWRLLAVDGRDPTPAELRHYADGADDRQRRHPLAFDLRAMVEPDQWRQLGDRAGQVSFEFRLRPTEELDARLVDKVRGKLVVDKVRQQPLQIVIENTEPAYVAPLVRVAEYRQEMTFEWDDGIDASVLARAETGMRGRALGLKALRQHKLVEYGDYQCVEPAL